MGHLPVHERVRGRATGWLVARAKRTNDLRAPVLAAGVAAADRLDRARWRLLTVAPREAGPVVTRGELVPSAPVTRTAARLPDGSPAVRDPLVDRAAMFPAIEHLELADVVVSGAGNVRADDLLLGHVDVLDTIGRGVRLKGTGVRAHAGLAVLHEEPRTPPSLDRAIVGCGFGGANWYHWLIEGLPRLALVTDLPPEFATWPVLLPERALRSPAARATVDLLLGDRAVVPLDRGAHVRLRRAVWIDPPVLGPRSYRPGAWPLPHHTGVHGPVLRRVRDRLRDAAARDTSTPSRVVLLRGGAGGRDVDEAALLEATRARGFRAVDPGRLTLAEQMAVVGGADAIVGAWGAAWANALVAREGSRGLVLAPEPFAGWSILADVAAVAGMDQRVVLGRSDADVFAEVNRRPYAVERAALDAALDALLAL